MSKSLKQLLFKLDFLIAVCLLSLMENDADASNRKESTDRPPANFKCGGSDTEDDEEHKNEKTAVHVTSKTTDESQKNESTEQDENNEKDDENKPTRSGAPSGKQ